MSTGDDDAAASGKDPTEHSAAFDLAPVSLWLEDFSRLKQLLAGWVVQGVDDIEKYIESDSSRLLECLSTIQIVAVNAETLSLYEAPSLAELVARLPEILTAKTMDAAQIAGLWHGKRSFLSKTINRTLTGSRLDIQLRGTILPGYEEGWERLLLVCEDVTELQAARHRAEQSETYARSLFEHSPVALWVVDYSKAKRILDEACGSGATSLNAIVSSRKESILQEIADCTIIDVNRQAMKQYGASDKAAFLLEDHKSTRIACQEDLSRLLAMLLVLSERNTHQEREIVCRRLDGQEIHIHQRYQFLPAHEYDWTRVQISETDVTARKKAEAHIQYLQHHDTLTGVKSRNFFNEEIARLTESGTYPISVIIGDLNGLKAANDCLGHGSGDQMLRLAGIILNQAVRRPWSVSRTGGDEFAILMPGGRETDSQNLIIAIQELIASEGDDAGGLKLSLSLGAATRRVDELLDATIARADVQMYQAKQKHYDGTGRTRRISGTPLGLSGPGFD